MPVDIEILILKDGRQISTVREGVRRLVVIYEGGGVMVYSLPEISNVVELLEKASREAEKKEGKEASRGSEILEEG